MDEIKTKEGSQAQLPQTQIPVANDAERVPDDTADVSKMPLRERLKSPAVWAAVCGAVAVILNAFGVFDNLGIDSAEFDAIVNSVGSVLIAFGILNNPTDRTNF